MKTIRLVCGVMAATWTLAALVAALAPRRSFTFPSAALTDVVIQVLPRHRVFLETAVPYGWWLLLTPLVVLVVLNVTRKPRHPLANVLLLVMTAAALSIIHAGLAYVLSYSTGAGFTVGPHPAVTGTDFAQRLPGSFFAFCVTAGVTAGVQLWRSARAGEEEASRLAVQASHLEAQLARAGLDALRMQLNPHFLFNTLHAIASTTDSDPAAARTMTIRLSELLRLTLEQSHQQYVTLQEELDWLEQYLDILEQRFEERLDVQMHIQPDALGAQLPALILQPLVENVMKHGADARDGRICLEIAAARHGDVLQLAVRDRGPGVLSADRRGFGLANTQQRLTTHFGDRQRFVLRDREGGGAEAVIDLPFRAGAMTDSPAEIGVREAEHA